jgi:hypothetical protein
VHNGAAYNDSRCMVLLWIYWSDGLPYHFGTVKITKGKIMRVTKETQLKYSGLDFRSHLRTILWEHSVLLRNEYLDWYNRPIDRPIEFQAGAYFTQKYGISLTVGDISALELDFEGHAKLLLDKVKLS